MAKDGKFIQRMIARRKAVARAALDADNEYEYVGSLITACWEPCWAEPTMLSVEVYLNESGELIDTCTADDCAQARHVATLANRIAENALKAKGVI